MYRTLCLILLIFITSCSSIKKMQREHGDARLPSTDTEIETSHVDTTHNHTVDISYMTAGDDAGLEMSPIQKENKIAHTDDTHKRQMGLITYSFPDTLRWDEYGTVELRITKNKNTTDFVLKNDDVVIDSIRVSNTMKVEIVDIEHAFEIQQLTSDTQPVDDGDDYTMWKWSIKPSKPGKHKLDIVIQIINNGVAKNIPVVTYEIYVQSQSVIKKLTTGLEDNVDWTKIVSVIITGGLFPLIIFLWKRRKKKKNKQ